jgi:hypothetical protein
MIFLVEEPFTLVTAPFAMPRNNKEMKSRKQKGKDAHSAAPINASPLHVAMPTHSKYGTLRSQSDPVESWDKTTERAKQTRRNRNLKVTLPVLPWNKE